MWRGPSPNRLRRRDGYVVDVVHVFQLLSITTVGYGDLAAGTDLGRLLATSEAVVGQIHLVTFVAMLVGLIQQSDRIEM